MSYSVSEPMSMEQLLSESAVFTVPQTWKMIKWKIIKKEKSQILVDIEWKMTWVISGKEIQDSLWTSKDLEEWDEIEAMVIEDDSEDWSLILSIRKASQHSNWDRFKKYMKSWEVITVMPTQANKWGLIVDVDWVKAFIPVSQLAPEHYPRVENSDSWRILTKLQSYVGKPFKVSVIAAEKETKKLIFSERAARKWDLEDALNGLKIWDIVKWKVTWVSKFGFFITFRELEWLVHISEIAWGHVKNPNEYAKVWDEIDVKVIWIENWKISLSLKRMKNDPWMEVAEKFKVWDKIKWLISKISEFWAFVSLWNDINWLIHVSEIEEWADDATKHFKVWDEVEAKVIEIVPDEHRVALSIKKDS